MELGPRADTRIGEAQKSSFSKQKAFALALKDFHSRPPHSHIDSFSEENHLGYAEQKIFQKRKYWKKWCIRDSSTKISWKQVNGGEIFMQSFCVRVKKTTEYSALVKITNEG